jgi:hypothetical protein
MRPLWDQRDKNYYNRDLKPKLWDEIEEELNVAGKYCPASSHETCQWLKFPPEWVTGPEQGKSSGRIAIFSHWTGVFRDGISSIPGETVISL